MKVRALGLTAWAPHHIRLRPTTALPRMYMVP
jgi:hypothetical protein